MSTDWGQALANALSTATITGVVSYVISTAAVRRQKLAENRVHQAIEKRGAVNNTVERHLVSLQRYVDMAYRTAQQDLPKIYYETYLECAKILKARNVLPWYERILLRRYCRRIYGQVLTESVIRSGSVGADTFVENSPIQSVTGKMNYVVNGRRHTLKTDFHTGSVLMVATRRQIDWMFPNYDDKLVEFDEQRRGLLNVHRLTMVPEIREQWEQFESIGQRSALVMIRITREFLNRKWWHVLYRTYRSRRVSDRVAVVLARWHR